MEAVLLRVFEQVLSKHEGIINLHEEVGAYPSVTYDYCSGTEPLAHTYGLTVGFAFAHLKKEQGKNPELHL